MGEKQFVPLINELTFKLLKEPRRPDRKLLFSDPGSRVDDVITKRLPPERNWLRK